MNNVKIAQNVSIAGRAFQQTKHMTVEGVTIKDVTVPAAKAGTLNAQTDNDTGTLVMSSGSHGITDADRLDVYWDGGSRHGMTVGSVSGTSVPIDGGTGDNLPSASTAITACVPVEEVFQVEGDDLRVITFYTQKRGIMVLAGSDDADDYVRALEAGGVSHWHEDMPDANPIVGDTVTKCFFSNGDSGASSNMRVAAGFDG